MSEKKIQVSSKVMIPEKLEDASPCISMEPVNTQDLDADLAPSSDQESEGIKKENPESSKKENLDGWRVRKDEPFECLVDGCKKPGKGKRSPFFTSKFTVRRHWLKQHKRSVI